MTRRSGRVAVSAHMLHEIDRLVENLDHRFPLPARALATAMGVNDRYVRRIVADARALGHPIISGNQGYRIGSREDLLRCAARLDAHAKRELKIARDLRISADQVTYRPGMFGSAN